MKTKFSSILFLLLTIDYFTKGEESLEDDDVFSDDEKWDETHSDYIYPAEIGHDDDSLLTSGNRYLSMLQGRSARHTGILGGIYECTGGDTFVMKTPNFPKRYPKDNIIKWKFRPDATVTQVDIECESIVIAISKYCKADKLKIMKADGVGSRFKKSGKQYCGTWINFAKSFKHHGFHPRIVDVYFESNKDKKRATGVFCTLSCHSCHNTNVPKVEHAAGVLVTEGYKIEYTCDECYVTNATKSKLYFSYCIGLDVYRPDEHCVKAECSPGDVHVPGVVPGPGLIQCGENNTFNCGPNLQTDDNRVQQTTKCVGPSRWEDEIQPCSKCISDPPLDPHETSRSRDDVQKLWTIACEDCYGANGDPAQQSYDYHCDISIFGWSSNGVSCQPIVCPELSILATVNSSIYVSGSYTCGSDLTLQCVSGRMLPSTLTEQTTTCVEPDTGWLPALQDCSVCSATPATVENAQFSLDTATNTATYTCDSGFEMSCSSGGTQWTVSCSNLDWDSSDNYCTSACPCTYMSEKLQYTCDEALTLNSIPTQCFKNGKKTVSGIIIKNNSISDINESNMNCFGGEKIILRNNKITKVPQKTFINNDRLTTVNLKDNSITCIGKNLFNTKVRKIVLYLDGNPITAIPAKTLKPFGFNSKIYLPKGTKICYESTTEKILIEAFYHSRKWKVFYDGIKTTSFKFEHTVLSSCVPPVCN